MPPRVPIYEQQINPGSVGQARVRVQAQTGSFRAEAQVGQAIGTIGPVADKAAAHYQKVVEAQDRAAVDAAYVKLSAAEQQILENPNTGILSRRGEAAIAARSEAPKMYQAAAGKIRKDLGAGSRRARMFDQLVAKRTVGFRSSVDRHVAREWARLEERNYQGVLTTSISGAVRAANRGDTEGVLDEIFTGVERINGKRLAAGWTDDELAAEKLTFTTNGYLNVLDAMIRRGDIAEAKDFLAQRSGAIEPIALRDSKIMDRLESAEFNATATLTADEIVGAAGADVSAALVATSEVDPRIRDNVEKRVMRYYRLQREAERATTAPVLSEIHTEMLTGAVITMDDPRVAEMPPFGQEAVAGWLAADARKSQPTKSDGRIYQNKVNKWAVYRIGTLSLQEQARMDPTSREWVFPGSKNARPDTPTRTNIDAHRTKAQEKLRRIGAVTVSEFEADIKGDEVWRSLTPKRRVAYIQFMRARYSDWAARVELEEGFKPDRVQVDAWWLQWRERESAWIGRGATRGELEARGKTFTPQEAPDSDTVTIYRPDGTAYVQHRRGPVLDEFLAKNKGWSAR